MDVSNKQWADSSYPRAPVEPRKKLPLWVWLFIISGGLFTLLVILIVLGSMGMLLSGQTHSSAYVERVISGSTLYENKALVIDVSGAIFTGEAESILGKKGLVAYILTNLDYAESNKSIKGVILNVRSPGGAIGACDTIYNRIKTLKKNRPDIKMVTLMEDLAASGGVYISMESDIVMATPTTITGSIGVIMSMLNISNLLNEIGVKSVVIKSGRYKDMLSSSREMTEEEREILTDIVKNMHKRFVDVIAEGRKNMSREAVEEAANGRIFLADEAREIGLIDVLGYYEDAEDALKTLIGADELLIVKYERPPNFIEKLFGAKLEDSQLNIETKLSSAFSTLTPMFLYLYSPGM